MDTIAALDTILAMFAKCTRLLREAGMPEGFYQRVIDDKDFRIWLVQTCKEKLQPKVVEPPRTSRLTKAFQVEVDYDDPENVVIPQVGGEVYYVDEALKPKHFPIRGKGKVVKKMRYLEFNYEPTTQEILDATKELKAENPDLADTRAFHKANPDERNQAPVASFCGGFEGHDGDRCVADVGANGRGLRFYFDRLQGQWIRRIRVLVLSESE